MFNKSSARKSHDSAIINIVMALCLIAAVFSANDVLALLVNVVVLLVMYILLRHGMGSTKRQTAGLHSLRNLASCLNKASEQLHEMDEFSPDKVRDILTCEDSELHKNDFVRTALTEYFNESDTLVRKGKSYYTCDIADYINDDLIVKASNAAFNDFISSAMTGLGILGTFIGLAIGLHSFHTETAEAMTNSIAPLIEGIKVAFYTSIFGVLFSLVYGTIFKFAYKHAESAVEEFVNIFHRRNGSRPENEAVSKILQYQEEQTDSLNQFAEEISIALADAIDKTISPALTQLPTQMSHVIQENIMPAMQSLEGSLQVLTSELAQSITQAQNRGMETIVDNFLEQMNLAVGGQMTNLATSIQSICEWEQETSEKLDAVVNSVCQNAEIIDVINDDLKDMVMQLASYISTLDTANEKLCSDFESAIDKLQVATKSMDEFTAKSLENATTYQEILETSSDLNDQITNQQEKVSELVESLSEQIHADLDFIKGNHNVLETTCNDISSKLSNAAERLSKTSEHLNDNVGEAMTRTYAQFDSQLAKAIAHFSGTLTELRDIVEKAPKIVDSIYSSMRREISDSADKVRQSQKDSTESIMHTTEALENKVKQLTSNLNDMLDKLPSQEAITETSPNI